MYYMEDDSESRFVSEIKEAEDVFNKGKTGE